MEISIFQMFYEKYKIDILQTTFNIFDLKLKKEV